MYLYFVQFLDSGKSENDAYNIVTKIQSKERVLVCPSKQASRDQIEKPATKQDVQTTII